MILRKCSAAFIIGFFILVFTPVRGNAGEVGLKRAEQVAINWISESAGDNRIVKGNSFRIIDHEAIVVKNRTVGYNFILSPQGHIIVPSRDELPVVKLYSFDSTMHISDNSDASRWISEELFKLDDVLDRHAAELARVKHSETRNGRLWARFQKDSATFARENSLSSLQSEATVLLGPLLSTTWDQGAPYNLLTPLYNGSSTYTGCVATAAAQIMKYWNYPATGQGSTIYSWYNGSTYQTLSADFSASSYDWNSMTNSYSTGGTTAQRQAVAKLMSDVGIAFHMQYGTSGSSASTMAGVDVFKNYFKYKDSIQGVYRGNYPSDSAWMQVFKNEVQSGRPSQLRIYASIGGHSVVVDGYMDSPTEQIHLNMGWSGTYNGWYVSNNIVTGSDYWTNVDDQAAVIGIEPKEFPLSVTISGNGSVNSTLLSCTSGTCTVEIGNGLSATLMPTAGNDSMFDGWSGGCDELSGNNCMVNMTSARSVTANFVTLPPVTTGGNYYTSFQSAYDNGASSCLIASKAVDLDPLDFTLDKGKTVVLEGGYDSSYSGNNGGFTSMKGTLSIGTGSLTVENLIIR
jgi:uncharacterized protein YneR